MKWRKKNSSQDCSRKEEDPELIAKDENADEEPATILIAGAGIVGLVLALALKKQIGVKAEIYEQARAFQDGIGNGIGMYPNGLRVIRAISPELLTKIQQAGYPYLCRRWEVGNKSVHTS
jgi:2-polyprenyl-6-methoxyphenol hydroxylase-like FAD-dependent oxidoreductase